eukprot:TRINITY_DN33923_c0_g1_i1.p1 TRINITY_DN33923_c0_g1~~TRINITY_DN33923_c0_g1_i1.p1  ORF type:complete len:277 (+),score=30.32 TRINITY_DN33923_c0_g1_i1:106-936(+)
MHKFAAILSVLPLLQGAGESPCADQYSRWISKPHDFPRTDQPKQMQGLHIACVWQDAEGIQLEAYMNGVDRGSPRRANLPATALGSWKSFRHDLKEALGFKKRSNHWKHLHLKQPFGVFSALGHRLDSPDEAMKAQLLFIFEGGQWYWPPVKIGHVHELPGTNFKLETLSVQPVIFRVMGFLGDHECERIVDLGEPGMHESGVSLMDKDKGRAAKDFRTSTQSRPSKNSDPLFKALDDRVANLTRIPVSHNEEVQILRYFKTQYERVPGCFQCMIL